MTTERIDASYRGRTIIIEADEDPPGRWRWSYLIDGRMATVGARAEQPDARSALHEGAKAARSRLDIIDRVRP